MAPNEKIKLRAKAKTLGVKGYERMSLDELRVAVLDQDSKTGTPKRDEHDAPQPRKTAPSKKAVTKRASARIAQRSATKTKTAPPRKSTTAKSRVSSAAKKATTKTTPPPAKKSASQKTALKKALAAKGKAKREGDDVVVRHYEGGKVGRGGYTFVDRSGIDWTLDSNVGRTGKRADVMSGLRRHKGDYLKVFLDLRDRAEEFYPNALKAYPKMGTLKKAAEHQLRWLIARVALDYAVKTNQHVGRRSTVKKAVPAKSKMAPRSTTTRTTTKTKTASKTKTAPRKVATASRAPRKAAPVKSKSKPTSKRATAQKPSQRAQRPSARRGVHASR